MRTKISVVGAGNVGATVAQLIAYKELGFGTAIAEMPAPYDGETMERFAGEVREMVDTA